MKKTTAIVLFSFLAAASVRADVIWQEPFNYTNGPISVTSTNGTGSTTVSNWITHNGSLDAYVNNRRLENAATGGTLNRSGDVHRNFPAPYNNSQVTLYASFILNCTNLPNAAGVYFAHYLTNSSTAFVGKLYALVGTNLCLPNTYRLGVSALSSAGPTAIFPVDLAMNQDYQVVFEWDPVDLWAASLWVAPNDSSDLKVTSSEIVSASATCPPQSLAFRQASSAGNWFCTISNLVVATTFDEAATNVWAGNSAPLSIVYGLNSVTNYVEVPARLSVVAAGQGLADFNYRWQKNGEDFNNPNGNSNVLPFPLPEVADTGNYGVIVSNIFTGVTVTNGPVLMWVTNGPPVIALQPTNQSVYPGKNVTISVMSQGTPTLNYSWLFNNGPVTNANVDLSTTNLASLSILNVSGIDTNGTFKCFISNDYGSTNSAAVQLTLLTPQMVNIDALHGFVDNTLFQPTNTSLYYTVSNAVVYTREVTNSSGAVNGGPFTAPPNAEFFMQDNSGGIAVFVAGGAATQPRQGDIVTVTGPLGTFNSMLQFSLNSTDPSQRLTVTGHTNTLPAPVVLPFSFTNGVGYVSVSNVIRHYEGLLVTLTNCYFPANNVGANFSGTTYVMTNASGGGFRLFLNAANTNVIGQPIPQFARTVTGPMVYFVTTLTTANLSSGFEIVPSTYSDIVAGPPTPVASSGGMGAGGAGVINWVAVPFVPYSVWWTTNVALPFTNQWTPIATGLTFGTASGIYADTVNTNLPVGFYRISSP